MTCAGKPLPQSNKILKPCTNTAWKQSSLLFRMNCFNIAVHFLLELDKSVQIFQELDIVLLFHSCAVVKKPLAKGLINSPFS